MYIKNNLIYKCIIYPVGKRCYFTLAPPRTVHDSFPSDCPGFPKGKCSLGIKSPKSRDKTACLFGIGQIFTAELCGHAFFLIRNGKMPN